MNTDAIIDAIRGVLLGTLGAIRTVAPDTYVEGLPSPMMADGAKRLRAGVRPSFDVSVSPPRRTGAVGPSTASRAVLAIDVLVTLTYAIATVADTESAAHRHAVRAQAAEDALAVTQALSWPGNLAADSGGNATGLVSEMLQEAAPPRVRREDWAGGLYELELSLRGLVLITQAVA